MSFMISASAPLDTVSLSHEAQSAVWFLGALVTTRMSGARTAGGLAILDHTGARGYHSPRHTHSLDEETFFVLDGELRIEVDGQSTSAGPGSAAVLPRGLSHAFVVTSPSARFLTLHTPAGFDEFIHQAGTPAADPGLRPPDLTPIKPAELATLATQYGIEIIGPPPLP